jgi:hypothetical protein
VLLPDAGFRKVLTEREELISCRELTANLRQQVQKSDGIIVLKNLTIADYKNELSDSEKELKSSRRKLFWKKTETWGWRIVAGILTYKLILP